MLALRSIILAGFVGLSLTVSLFGHSNPITIMQMARAQTLTPNVSGPTDVTGRWKTHGAGIVDISPCEDSVCGKLVWFESMLTADSPVLDAQNKDESLRTRPLEGVAIVYGYMAKKKGWRKGRIYDPEVGETYRSKLTRISPTELKVEGCVGPICRDFIWTWIDPDAPLPTAPITTEAITTGPVK